MRHNAGAQNRHFLALLGDIMHRTKPILALFAALVMSASLLAMGPATALAQDSGSELAAAQSADLNISTQAVTKYKLWIGSVQVTSANASDVLGNGTVSYNASKNILTLKNAKIKSYNEQQLKKAKRATGLTVKTKKPLTIKLVGSNTIATPYAKSARQNYGLLVQSNIDVTIAGNGKLTVKANKATTYSAGIASSNGTVIIKGKARVAVKAAPTTLSYEKEFGGYALFAPVKLAGSAKLVATGAKSAFYKHNAACVPSFDINYVPNVKAGASAKSIKVNKKNPAQGVYRKYKYVCITNATTPAPTTPKPEKMVIKSCKAITKGLEFTFNFVEKNCTSYLYQVSESMLFPVAATWPFATTTNVAVAATVSGLTSSHTYYARICAVNKVGNSTVYGDWSNVVSVKVL